MYHYSEQFIQSVWIRDVVHGIEQTQLKGKCNTIREFDVFLHVFLVLESLQMKGEHVWQNLDFHPGRGVNNVERGLDRHKPSLSFLEVATSIAKELFLLAEHFASTKLSKTSGDT